MFEIWRTSDSKNEAESRRNETTSNLSEEVATKEYEIQ